MVTVRDRFFHSLYRLPIISIFIVCAGTFCLAAPAPVSAGYASSTEDSPAGIKVADGAASFNKGDFANAVLLWTAAAGLLHATERYDKEIETRIHIARAYRSLGLHDKSLAEITLAFSLLGKTDDRSLAALVTAELGTAHAFAGTAEKARGYLEKSLVMAREINEPGVMAIAYNTLGDLLMSQKKYSNALAFYTDSVNAAMLSGDHALAAKASIDAAAATLLDNRLDEAERLLGLALERVQALPDSHDKAYGLINIGQSYRRFQSHAPESGARYRALAYDALHTSVGVAERIGHLRALSYGLGYLGQVYEGDHRTAEALRLTQRAVFAAQSVEAPELLYLWQWQTGRLLKKGGDLDGALPAYRRATQTLQTIRDELSGCRGGVKTSFKESAGPVFFEFVDLLLQKADLLGDSMEAEPYLIEARETSELLKEAELQDYFQDECVRGAQAKATPIEQIAHNTAVVYTIMLPDRTELLVSLPTGLKRFKSGVTARALTEEVRTFREKLEKRTTREYLPYAQQLYDWLIRPIESALRSNRIDTLVFIPDAALRTIPMAALHDGKHFLISKYATVTTPGFNLTDPRPIQRETANILLAGLTQPVQGFPALQFVSTELEAIEGVYHSTLLKDDRFLALNVKKELDESRFSIVHIASHGKFEKQVENSFLLTFNDKLDMNGLEKLVGSSQLAGKPVELLTLSACQTAAGDDRAALGLAGVAIKAGARSALATLWFINDRTTSLLIEEFYAQYKDPSVSKAKALQKAQLKLMSDRRYRHPGYWSPFLLIGNWL